MEEAGVEATLTQASSRLRGPLGSSMWDTGSIWAGGLMVGLPWLDGISSIIVPTPWGSLLSASHEPRGTTAASARLQPHKQPTTHDEWSAPDCVQYNCGVQGPVLWQQTNNPVSKQTKQRSYRMSQRNLTPAGLSQSAQCYHRVWGEKMVLTTKWDKKKIGLLWQETCCAFAMIFILINT